MPIGFEPNGPFRRKLASDGVEIAAKFAKRRLASTPAGTGSRAVKRRRIGCVCLLGAVLLGPGPIASVAPLTTTAVAGEARDAAAAGGRWAESGKATAPKLRPDGLRGEEKGVVPSLADIPGGPEKDAGDLPDAVPSMTCAEALASEPLRNMDQYLDDIGVLYEKIFDQALSGSDCTGVHISDHLVDNGAYLDRFVEYNNSNNYYLRYRSKNFLNLSFFIPFHISIVEGKNGHFQYSRWNMTFL